MKLRFSMKSYKNLRGRVNPIENRATTRTRNLRDEILEFIAFFHQVFSYRMNFFFHTTTAMASICAMSELYCDNELDIVENEKEYHDHENMKVNDDLCSMKNFHPFLSSIFFSPRQ